MKRTPLYRLLGVQVTKQFPDDVEAWIALARILEQSDSDEALSTYYKIIELMRKNAGIYISPEMLNNIAVLHYKYELY